MEYTSPNSTLAVTDSASLDDVEKLLRSLPRDTSAQTRENNLAIIKTLADREFFGALLARTLDDPVMLSVVAARSYPHANHFDKIVLVDSADKSDYRLTLHLW